KKPFVFTNRAKRLYLTNIILNIIIAVLLTFLSMEFILDKSIYLSLLILLVSIFLMLILYVFQAYISLLANKIISPVESKINKGFYDRAKEKISKMEDLIVVGITGSFGKTSTKFILGTILSEKYNILNTHETYNTPMCQSKVINN